MWHVDSDSNSQYSVEEADRCLPRHTAGMWHRAIVQISSCRALGMQECVAMTVEMGIEGSLRSVH